MSTVSSILGSPPSSSLRCPQQASERRIVVLLAALVLAATAPVVQYLLDQQSSRMAFTAAVWDHRTLQIDEYAHVLGVDYAEHAGHLYSDKAPGQPLASVLPYALYRAVGGEPVTVPRKRGNLGVWWVSLWAAAVPAAVLAVLMRAGARRVSPATATSTAVVLSFGTLLLPFSTLLFSHVLAGLFGYGAYLLADDLAARRSQLVTAGALAGGAVLTEYTGAVVVAVLVLWATWKHGRRAIWMCFGGVPAAAVLLYYNYLVFGGPFAFSYRNSGTFGEVHARGLVGASLPDPATLAEVLVGGRGLFTLTPVVLAGVVGLVSLWRHGGRDREIAVVAGVIFTGFVALQSGWPNPYGGASPGPRYVVPALPFLAPGVAAAFRAWPRATTAAAVWGAVFMALATYTHPLVGPDEAIAVDDWFSRAREGDLIPTLFTPQVGDWGLALVAAAVSAVGLALWRAAAASRQPVVSER